MQYATRHNDARFDTGEEMRITSKRRWKPQASGVHAPFLKQIECEASSSLLDGNVEMVVASMIERTGA